MHGPFKVPVNCAGGEKSLNGKVKSTFWNGEASYLEHAKGCYVFARQAGKGFTPLYVGQTKKTFKGECFNAYNQVNLADVISGIKGTLVLFLLEYEASGGPVNKRAINDLERHLVETALLKNKDLINKKLTANGPSFLIRGVHVTPGKPSASALTFKKAMGYGTA